MSTLLTEGTRAAYDELAPAYDRLTAHHRQEAWLSTIETLALEHGLTGKRLLDIGCGTGNSFLPLLRRGYEVTGSDLSPEMVDIARRKSGGKATVFTGDMRELGAIGEFDLVTCLDDALNYLSDENELRSVFRGVAGNLAAGGLFVFDVNTLRTYRTTFARDECWEADGCFFAWRGEAASTAARGVVAAATVEAFLPEGMAWRRVTTRHVQRHFSDDIVRKALCEAGLSCAAACGYTSDGELSPAFDELRDNKRVYVARNDL
jgi:SAM-dependent methyltransferase